MKFLFLLLIPFVSFVGLAQNYNAQIEGEWLLPATKKYNSGLIKLKEGKFQAEFFRQTNYLFKENYLTIYADDPIAYAPEYEEIRKKGYYTKIDTLSFTLKKVDSDSLVLEADNLSAKEFVYYLSTILSYDSTKKVNPLKLYRRELSFKKIEFDSIQLSVSNSTLTIDNTGNYFIKSSKKKSTKSRQLARSKYKRFNNYLYISNIESFKIPPRLRVGYNEQGDKLILFKNSESIRIDLSRKSSHGDFWEIPWTLKPLFDFLNSLAEKK